MDLYQHQKEAIEKMHDGCVLVGGVGTGKTRTALAYYYIRVCGGSLQINGVGKTTPLSCPRPLYIITTAKKRDTHDWENECVLFGIKPVAVDSWNNIKKYTKVYGAMFIFDEQRVVGYGAWTKAFLNIARKNQWILLSATPGDTWSDYIPVFIANGFYKNLTEFRMQHIVYKPFRDYPIIDHYQDTGRLIYCRNRILVPMHFQKHTEPHKLVWMVNYDRDLYRQVMKTRWDIYNNKPIENSSSLFYTIRKVVNSDPSRLNAVGEILSKHNRAIIFYNFDYELDLLRDYLDAVDIPYTEWNGQKHEEVLGGDHWAYLVQYTAGAEGWNCITTDTTIFYSLNYSYRITEQASGRIDRLNTPYTDLYFYSLKSSSPIDTAIARALGQKRNFNQKSFKGL